LIVFPVVILEWILDVLRVYRLCFEVSVGRQ
jgi:hypothetical protein